MSQCKAELKIFVDGEEMATYFCVKEKGHEGFHCTEWPELLHKDKYFSRKKDKSS